MNALVLDSIFINYDPFGKKSQLLVTREGKTVGNTYCDSELAGLAETAVKTAQHHGISRVYVRAPQVFYDELNRLAQAAQKRIFGLSDNIVLERVV